MKTITSIMLFGIFSAAALTPLELSAEAAEKNTAHQTIQGSSAKSPYQYKKVRRDSKVVAGQVTRIMTSSRKDITTIKQAHLIHTALPNEFSPFE